MKADQSRKEEINGFIGKKKVKFSLENEDNSVIHIE